MSDTQAVDGYAELAEKRAAAQQKVQDLNAQQRVASEAYQAARVALVEAERRGARAAELRKLEEAVTTAEVKPKLLQARIEGATHATRDADVALAQFVQGHLTELVAPLEEQGQLIKLRIDAAAEAIVTGIREREEIARRISELASMAAPVRPGDITFTRVEGLARQAADLLRAGGEDPPTLRRDPRQPQHGQRAEAAA